MIVFTAMRRATLLLLPLLVADLWAAPLTKYDQRQEGELNVHAHLENFVILLIPGGSGLFNIAAKIASGKHHSNKHLKTHAEGGSKHTPEEQSVAVPLGVKSPPYKVDIDADRRTPIILEITAPHIGEEQHEVVIAESPAVTFTKTQAGEKEKPSSDSEKPEPEKSEPEKPSSQTDASEKPSDEKPIEGDKPSKAIEKPSAAVEKPSGTVEKPSSIPEKPSATPEKPKESAEKPQNLPSPPKSEAIKPVEKPLKKPVEAPAVAPAAAAAADQKEVAAPSDAERPAVPAKPAAVAAAAVADAPASPAAQPAQLHPPKQVAQEAKSRAARLELLRTGLAPSPAEAPCSAHEVHDGRCGRTLEPVRVTGNYEDAVLLKALRFGLAPAN